MTPAKDEYFHLQADNDKSMPSCVSNIPCSHSDILALAPNVISFSCWISNSHFLSKICSEHPD